MKPLKRTALRWLQPRANEESDMIGEICVVTGATSGIGRATAIGLAKKGARVVLVARNQAKATQLVDEISKIPGVIKPEVVIAELSEMKQVCRASDEIRNRFDHVDVLINNAGGMFDTYHQSSEGIEEAYAVNHLAVVLLTLSLHPSLEKAKHPRVVIVSSHVQNVPLIRDYAELITPEYDWSKVYAQTKLRTSVFARALSERWKDDGITVNSLHPGFVDTGLMSGMDNGFLRAIFTIAKHFFMSPAKGARTSIFLSSDPSVANVTGKYFVKCKSAPYNSIADDVVTQNLLWDESMTFLKEAGIDGVGASPSPSASFAPRRRTSLSHGIASPSLCRSQDSDKERATIGEAFQTALDQRQLTNDRRSWWARRQPSAGGRRRSILDPIQIR